MAELNNSTGASVGAGASQRPNPRPIVKQPVKKVAPVRKRSKSNSSLYLIILLVFTLAIAIGTAAYFINRYHDAQNRLNNPTATANAERDALIAKIGVLTILPTNETPATADVVDTTKLSSQPFFANAQNGDKVLIYTKSKKAILYRPSTNKIVNIAPVNLGSGQ